MAATIWGVAIVSWGLFNDGFFVRVSSRLAMLPSKLLTIITLAIALCTLGLQHSAWERTRNVVLGLVRPVMLQ